MVRRGQDGRFASFRDKVWHVMANTPENYSKKVIYNDTMAKLTREGMNPLDAHLKAWKKVEDTLFDYSKITVLEDNLRVFFPFIQFWRKNTGFWVKSVATKPWLTEEFLNWQHDRSEQHKDWPGWMKRYVDMQDISDAVSFVPGLSWLVDNTMLRDAQFDPLSFSSFNTYYRAFKSRNQDLAPGEQAKGFFGSILDALDSWGLGLNPLIRKGAESAGVAEAKNWQTIFPQTSMAVAVTRKWFGQNIADGLLDLDHVLTLGLDPSKDDVAANFNFYVQREMADQRARGEQPNRALAEKTIRAWFYMQTVWGYFGGVYFRKNSPQDFYLSKLTDDLVNHKVDYSTLDESQKLDIQLWSAAKKMQTDPLAFDRYTIALPLIESYFRAPDFDTRQQMLQDHPELAEYVDKFYGSPQAYSRNYISRAALYQKGQEYFALSALMRSGRMAFDVKQAANAYLITPELQEFWDSNDTPEQIREKMVKHELYGYLLDVQKTYFSLPETDFAARKGFLDEHPALGDFWLRNNLASDDFTAIHNSQNADLREAYFDIVKAHGKRGFALAQPFLHDHPFIFEGTSASAKVDAQTGEWMTKGSVDYRNAKPYLDHFFQLIDSGHKRAAYHWLDSSLPGAKVVRDFFKNHGKHSAKQRDYIRAKPYLKLYFGMPEDKRREWLSSGGKAQRVVSWYFKKYAHQAGMTAHGKDYLAVKSVMDRYFAMPKSDRAAWLNAGSPEADRLLAYFKKYGTLHATEKAWAKAADHAHLVRDPELRRRVAFWTRYFSLTPDKRGAFLHDNAEDHGIFIWGALGDGDSHAREMDYIRRAMQLKFTVDGKHHHLTEKQATYSYVKPLLDLYNSMSKDDRKLFAATNPEVADYFSRFGQKHITGSKRLDKLVEDYFALPADSLFRSKFLRDHPDVQQFFDKHSTAQERAIRNMLNVYFELPLHDRKRYAAKHPELSVYFDKRRRERGLANAVNEQLLREDPRFSPFFETADPDLGPSAERMAANLRLGKINRFSPDSIELGRERHPSA
jgi:hypothetical protein